MRALWAAVRLLTGLPTPDRQADEPTLLVSSLVWFPAVGAGIGLAAGLVELALRRWVGYSVVACGAAVVVVMLVTVGRPARGLMVTVGALFSGRDKERVTELATGRWPMGFGVLVGMLGQLLRYALLLAIAPEARLWALIAACGLARSAIVWVCWRFPYAETDTGVGGYLANFAGPRDLLPGLPLLAVAFGGLHPLVGVAAVVGALLGPHLFAWWIGRILGGVNANGLEAVAEVGELACLGAVAGAGQLLGHGLL